MGVCLSHSPGERKGETTHHSAARCSSNRNRKRYVQSDLSDPRLNARSLSRTARRDWKGHGTTAEGVREPIGVMCISTSLQVRSEGYKSEMSVEEFDLVVGQLVAGFPVRRNG